MAFASVLVVHQRTVLISVVSALGVLAWATAANAVVTEPDGRTVPQWEGYSSDLTLGVECCGVLPDGSDSSLQALFDSRGENIHWQNDASTAPAYFSPLCNFGGSLVLRGGGCKVDFGWYNVDLDDPNPPDDSEIYPLVSVADVQAAFASGVYGVPDENLSFAPLVGEPPIDGETLVDVRAHPGYAGGYIGLATRGNPNEVCTQTHYSEARLNNWCTTCDPAGPWIMAIMYQSTVVQNAFYIAFEDLPASETSFEGYPGQQWQNDGDFNDFVFFVEGITCQGGGQPCVTAAEGACGPGLTECQPDGNVVCVSQVQPSDEVCDNVDNDCNGLVDEGELCPSGEVCDAGVCRPNCSGGEFPCESPLVCDGNTGLCTDPACLGITCEAGQICRDGACVGGCDDVVCPQGQICQLGRCVDPCRDRIAGSADACPEGTVCEGGVCVETCMCRVCGTGTECDPVSGSCVPTGCADVACPDGQRCELGECVDACHGVVCPGGASCEAGVCADPQTGTDPATGGSGTGGGSGGGPVGPVGAAGAGLIGAAGAGTGAEGNLADTGGDEPGCGCVVAGRSSNSAPSALWLLTLGLLLRYRRPSRTA